MYKLKLFISGQARDLFAILALFKLLDFIISFQSSRPDEYFELAIHELVNGSLNYDFDRLSSLAFNPLFKKFKSIGFTTLIRITHFMTQMIANIILQISLMI